MKLTAKQLEHGRSLIKLTTAERKAITLWRGNDPGYSLFRLTATNNIMELYTRIAKNQKPTKKLTTYFETWLCDGVGGVGDYYRDFIAKIEAETGKPLPFKRIEL